jgi:hypothetical protein
MAVRESLVPLDWAGFQVSSMAESAARADLVVLYLPISVYSLNIEV